MTTKATTAPARGAKISFVSLGCPKALVDSERIITRLRAEGYELAPQHDGADLVIVNTCGFLDSAKEESLGAVGQALAENGKVIVTGCMGAEPETITQRYPNVLAVTGPQQYESVLDAVHRAAPPVHDPFLDLLPPEGIKLTPRHYAYLKISEGCNNRCTFCIIPKLRGDLVSRPAADVMREAERLVAAGVKELLVISQDTSAYGVDLKYATSTWRGHDLPAKFLDLARALGDLGVWVRLHYVYPYPHVDDVIPLMAGRQAVALSRRPVSAREPGCFEAHASPGRAGKDARADPALACDLSGSDHSVDLHRRFSRRDGRRFRPAARLARGGSARSRRLLPLRTGRRRRQQRSCSPGRGGRERGPLAPADAASAGDLDATPQTQNRDASAGDHRSGRPGWWEGPHQGRCARDRRQRACDEPSPAARRRDCDRQGRPRRRL